eukprot:scaffold37730_cov28-Tisochrysis_lutea.AAC.5
MHHPAERGCTRCGHSLLCSLVCGDGRGRGGKVIPEEEEEPTAHANHPRARQAALRPVGSAGAAQRHVLCRVHRARRRRTNEVDNTGGGVGA